MSLLSDTAHTPDRILALMRVAEALGDDATRDATSRLMVPSDSDQAVAFAQTLGAAASLGLVGTEQDKIQLKVQAVPASHEEFADLCYDLLLHASNHRADANAEAKGNALLLAAYAIVCSMCDQYRSQSWFCDNFDRDAFADEVRRAVTISEATEGAFNTTRIVPWRRWMQHIGLMEDIGHEVQIPDVARRLKREIQRRDTTSTDPWAARDFLAWARVRMPFLPGGQIFQDVTAKTAKPSDCGVVLSAALRSLRDERFLEFRAIGDSSGHAMLASDDADVTKSFSEIVFPSPKRTP